MTAISRTEALLRELERAADALPGQPLELTLDELDRAARATMILEAWLTAEVRHRERQAEIRGRAAAGIG